jgi:hypothetical protein
MTATILNAPEKPVDFIDGETWKRARKLLRTRSAIVFARRACGGVMIHVDALERERVTRGPRMGRDFDSGDWYEIDLLQICEAGG